MLVMPFKATAEPKTNELSSIFQPVTFTADTPVLVNSNQSAPSELLPLDHGATSEMMIPAFAIFGTMTTAAATQHKNPPQRRRRIMPRMGRLRVAADDETNAASGDERFAGAGFLKTWEDKNTGFMGWVGGGGG